ncbi:MAG: hypothetical protein U5L00_00405 [Desulfovermiculus sp.]|nr:hypothetical protein [Desulfovermiculus sp.]
MSEIQADSGGMDLASELHKRSNFSIVPDTSLPKEVAARDLGACESQVLAKRPFLGLRPLSLQFDWSQKAEKKMAGAIRIKRSQAGAWERREGGGYRFA